MYNFPFRIKDTVHFFIANNNNNNYDSNIKNILLHNGYKIINFAVSNIHVSIYNFTKNIECWPVFKQDPTFVWSYSISRYPHIP